MRARLAWVLFGLGSLLLACGLVAGVVNHEVMDGQRFAAHVDNIRKDPAVARAARSSPVRAGDRGGP